MCGRYLLKALPRQVIDFFGLIELEDFPPRYNIAPTQPILVVLAGPPAEPGSNRPVRYAQLARWGFLPSWLKDTQGFPLLINARSETAAEKNTFRGAMRHRRALVPASGFYEWKRDKGGKGKSQAYWVRPADGGIVAFAALMETWHGPDGSEVDTVAILTTAANGEFAAIHDRMPVTIAPEDFDRWLDCRGYEPREVDDLLTPPPEGLYEAVPISDRVNKVANTAPDILERVGEQAQPEAAPPEPKKDDQLDLF